MIKRLLSRLFSFIHPDVALAIAAEREACAKVCDVLADDPMMSSEQDAKYCAEAIRKSSNAGSNGPSA
jgi:hypothetical protein